MNILGGPRFIALIGSLLFFGSAHAEMINGWNVQLGENPKFENELRHSQEVKIYTGDLIIQEITKAPESGNQFIIIHIKTEQQDTNAASFKPNLLVLKNGERVFTRLKEDAFLNDFSMNPFPHLNIKRGSHHGYLIYEVPNTIQKVSVFYDSHELKVEQ